MINNQLLYKEVKKYKNLENHWIRTKIKKDKEIVLYKKYILLKFASNNSACRILYKLIEYKDLSKYNLNFNSNMEFEEKPKFLNVWNGDNNNIVLQNPLQYTFFKKSFIEKYYIINKKLFLQIEQKKTYNYLKNKKLLLFNYLNIWKKVYNMQYSKSVLKLLLIKFLQKQNLIYKNKNNFKKDFVVKSIFLGFYQKGFFLYTPSLLKISFISFKYLNKYINKLIYKKIKKRKDWFILYSFFFTYNIYCEVDIKFINDLNK